MCVHGSRGCLGPAAPTSFPDFTKPDLTGQEPGEEEAGVSAGTLHQDK